MSDEDGIFGELGAYVPCDQEAGSLPLVSDDLDAAAGHAAGYVPPDDAAGSLPASGADATALYGGDVGFVAKPCEEVETLLLRQSLNDADFQPQSRRIIRHTSGAPDDVRIALIGADGAVLGDNVGEDEYRTFFHHEYGVLGGPAPTHVRLRTRIWGHHNGSFVASSGHPPAGGATALPTIATPYEIRNATWGTGTPIFDDIGGPVLASGSLYTNEQAGVGAALPTYSDLSVRWPVSTLVTGFVLMIGSPFPDANSLVTDFTGISTLPHRGYEEHGRYPFQPPFRNYGHVVTLNRPDGLIVETVVAYYLEWLLVT